MKKVLSLVLAVVLVLGMSAVAFAKVDKTNPHYDNLKSITLVVGMSGTQADGHIVQNDARPGDKYQFAIYDDVTKTVLNRNDIRDLDLDVQIRATEGGKAVDTYKIKYTSAGLAYVEVTFVKKFVSTKDMDFDILIYLTSEKKRLRNDNGNADYNGRISGTLENYYTEVDEYDDYVYVYDAPVVKALDYIKNIEVDLGQGISIYAKMFEDKNYYGYVSQEIKEADESIVAKYPDIQTIYYLETIGLSSTGDVVGFHDLGDNFYVYVQNSDGDLVYIGRTNDRLPYFTKYFLANKELPVDATLNLEDLEPVEPAPEAGGDGPALGNVNHNPSTGR